MPGCPTNLDIVGQGPTVLAVGGCLDIFFSHLLYLIISSN